MHGRARGRARGNLHDGSAEVDLRRVGADPGQRREAVGTIDLGAPDGIVPEGLGLLGEFDDPGSARGAEGTDSES